MLIGGSLVVAFVLFGVYFYRRRRAQQLDA